MQVSDWDCTVEEDGTVRLGLRYVARPARRAGRAIERTRRASGIALKGGDARTHVCGAPLEVRPRRCVDDRAMQATPGYAAARESPDTSFCNVCSHHWDEQPSAAAVSYPMDELVRVVGLRRDEVTALAEIGALNSFGYDRRSALWQAERAVRPAGELFDDDCEDPPIAEGEGGSREPQKRPSARPKVPAAQQLRALSPQ